MVVASYPSTRYAQGSLAWRCSVTDRRPSPPLDLDEQPGGDSPSGAVAITLFLAATILVLWFGMYVLNVVRS